MNAIAVTSLSRLAWRINDQHEQVEAYARNMLFFAKAAGEALIEAKKRIPHGQFKQWVEDNTKVSIRQAQNYMKVAREWDERKNAVGRAFADLSIDAFLGYEKKPKTITASNLPVFTQDIN